MTKHAEVRQILHDTGFKFTDGRTALDMTDEEVEQFVVIFIARMSELGRQMTKAMHTLTVSITQALEPLQNLGHLLEESVALGLTAEGREGFTVYSENPTTKE